MATLVFIQESPSIAQAFGTCLRHSGHTVIIIEHGEQLAAAVQAASPDLIVLDGMRRDQDGTRIAQQLNDNPQTRSIPIVVLAALPAEQLPC